MKATTDVREEKRAPSRDMLTDYELLSVLFFYPENESDIKKIKDVYSYLSINLPESTEVMKPFMEFISSSNLGEIQELFLRSFDIQAITTLDIGFILFGEDYKRGQLLVHLNMEHREAGNICHTELSDHMPNVLRLLPKMKDDTLRMEIATQLLAPAVVKMLAEFDPEKVEKKDKVYKKHLKTIIDYSTGFRTVYQTLLQVLLLALKKDFDYEPERIAATDKEEDIAVSSVEESLSCSSCSSAGSSIPDYTRNIQAEMDIEKF
ncbi:MAG: hypothetical protein WC380_07335 [Pedobacter sp.]